MAQISRHKTKVVKIGRVAIGGSNPIAVQSMAKCKTSLVKEVTAQINSLEKYGCEIVRLAVKDVDDARALRTIKRNINIPLVADIHFNWKFALMAIDAGVDKIRLNPGNIQDRGQIKEIAVAARLNKIPIRVGVNSGSLVRGCSDTASSMVKSALDYVRILEGFKFDNIVVSLKASDIYDTVQAYKLIARKCNYPLHVGTTATGVAALGLAKSSIAIGSLLLEGIGDTIRVSLTDSPIEEIKAARNILQALCLRNFGPQVISCPTCGRCEINLIKLVRDFDAKLSAAQCLPADKLLKVALMGCVVNGPGEAKEADLGVAFGRRKGLLFKNGKILGKVSIADCNNALIKEIKTYEKAKIRR